MERYINTLIPIKHFYIKDIEAFLLSFVFILFTSLDSVAQTVLVTETFETDGEGSRYTGNDFNTNSNEYFERKSATSGDIDGFSLSNHEGSQVWASEDVSTARSFVLNPVDVSGYDGLNVDLLIAARSGNFETTDYLRVEYAFEGSMDGDRYWQVDNVVVNDNINEGSFTPPNGGSAMPSLSELSITYHEDVTVGTGNITVYDATNASTLGTIPVASADYATTNTVKIDVSGLTFLDNTTIEVSVDAGTFTDGSTAIVETTDWSFIIDSTPPSAFTTGEVITTGGTVVSSVWNSTNTGVDITVPIDNDATLDRGTLQIIADVDGAGFDNLGTAATILNANLGGSQTVSITAAQLETLGRFGENSVISFNAIISDTNGNPTTGTVSATTLTVDQAAPSAFTTGEVITTGGTVVSSVWNSTNTGVDITVPIDNDATLDRGTLQIIADVDGAGFDNLGTAATILNANLGGSQTVSITAAQLETLGRFGENSVISFNARITDINGNPTTTGTVSATTLTVDQAAPSAFTTGEVITTGGTVVSSVWNSTNTGVDITVPIDNDATLDRGTLQIIADVDGAGFDNLGTTATILNANLGGSQTVSITAAQLETLGRFGEGVVIFFNAIISDTNGNLTTTGTVSATTLTVDQAAPSAFTTGEVITTGGTVVSSVWNSTNTGVDITVPIDNDATLDRGTLQIIADVDGAGFDNLGTTATILNANLGGSQTVSITAAQLETLGRFGENSVISFNAIISDTNGNLTTTGTVSATTLTVDQAAPSAFTTGEVITTGGTVVSSVWNSTNTGVDITVPIDNDASLDRGTLQIIADVDGAGFDNLGTAATILNANLGGSQTVSITAAQLETLGRFGENSVISFNAIISDTNGNLTTTGTASATTLTVDQAAPSAFTTGEVITTGGTVVLSVWNSTNTGVDITVPIDNDATLDRGTLQIIADVDGAGFDNLGTTATILNANLGGLQTVSITAAQLETLGRFGENSVISFNARITDINGNPTTTGTVSATTLTVDQAAPSAFTTGEVITTGGTVVSSVWNSTNKGVNITVPIADDASLDGGLLQIIANVNGGVFDKLGAVDTILNTNINGSQIVSITAAQLKTLGRFGENSVISFNARITDINGNPTTGTVSATTLTVDQAAPSAFTTGSVITTGGMVIPSVWNSTNTGVDITVPIADDASLDGGLLQIIANVNGGVFDKLGAVDTILNTNINGSQIVSITATQLETLGRFGEDSVIYFNAKITDINGNPTTTGTVSATTLTVDQVVPSPFTTGAVITTGGTLLSGIWNASNTGVNITVPIANDSTLDGGSIQIIASVDGLGFDNLGTAATILNANLDSLQIVSITAAQLEGLGGFGEGSVISFNAIISDTNGNPTTGTVSTTTLTVDQAAPSAFTTGSVITTGGTTVSEYWNGTNKGVDITVPIANDASLDGGLLQIIANVNGGVFDNLGTATAILNANLGGSQTVSITAVQLEALVGFDEGTVVSFNVTISDIATNTTTGTVSTTMLTVDQKRPTLSPNEISLNQTNTEITLTISEELNLTESGRVSGFTVNNGTTNPTATYTDKGTNNLISMSGSSWTPASTLVTYSESAGNVVDLAGNELDESNIQSKGTVTNAVTIAPGDIAFTGYIGANTDVANAGTASDKSAFSFVLLKDVLSDTKIKFTDNGWKDNNTFTTAENTISWIASGNLLAGTEVTISMLTASTGTVTGDALFLGTEGGGNSGDQVLAYQGTSNHPTFMAAIHMNEDYDMFSGNDNNKEKSSLPLGLTDGVNSIAFSSEVDNATYKYATEATSGTPAFLLGEIYGNDNHWGTDDDENNAAITFPNGGLNYDIPPHVEALTPIHGAKISPEFTTLQMDFNENMQSGVLTSGNITIKKSGGGTITTIPVDSSSITINNDVISIDITETIKLLTHEGIYEIYVDDFMFRNNDDNHNESINGATAWSFTYDSLSPEVLSIVRINADPHNADTGGTSVDFAVTFSENVNGVDTTDFITSASSSNLTGTPTISNVRDSSRTVFIVTVSGFDLNDASPSGILNLDLVATGTITDDAGNDNTSAAVANADEEYTIINPEPNEKISSLTSSAQTTTSITLNWTNSVTDQVAYQHLILVKESGTFTTPVDGTTYNDPTLAGGTVGQMAINVKYGIDTLLVSGLNSGTSYDFEIYPYTNNGKNINYQASSPAYLTKSTTTATSTTVAADTATTTLSSIIDTSGEAIVNFDFTVLDDGISPGADNAITDIQTIVISSGTKNTVADWLQVLLVNNAELTDGMTTVLGKVTNSPNAITFDLSRSLLGDIEDDSSRTYQLKVWLKSDLDTLKETIEGQILDFSIMNSGFTLNGSGSQLAPRQTASSGNNVIEVTTTHFVYNDNNNPILPIQGGREVIDLTNVAAPFPVFEARDANGNLDVNYRPINLTPSTAGGISISLNRSFVNGKINLNAVELGQPATNSAAKTNGTFSLSATSVVNIKTTSTINVVDTEVLQLTAGVETGPVLSAKASDLALMGLQLNAITSDPGQPVFTEVTFEFRNNLALPFRIDTVFSNFRLFQSPTNNFNKNTAVNLGVTPVIDIINNLVTFSGINKTITDLTSDQNYFIVADVNADASGSTPSIQPYLTESGIILTNDNAYLTDSSMADLNEIVGYEYKFLDEIEPEIESLNPTDGSIAANIGGPFSVTFDEGVNYLNNSIAQIDRQDDLPFDVFGRAELGPLTLTVVGQSADLKTITFELLADFDGDPLTVDPMHLDLKDDVDYFITIEEGVLAENKGVIDPDDHPFAGILNNTTWNFKTKDNAPPVLSNLGVVARSLDDQGFSIKFESNETGKAYYIVKDQADALLTLDDLWDNINNKIKQPAGITDIDSVDILIPDQTYSVFINGLSSPPNNFRVYVLLMDPSLNTSTILTTDIVDNITTPLGSSSNGVIVTGSDQDICVGNPISLIAPIIIKEGDNDDFQNGGTYRIGLNSSKFIFETDSIPTIRISDYDNDGSSDGDVELINSSVSLSFSDLSFEYSHSGFSNRDFIEITGLYVKALELGSSAEILRTGGTANQTGNAEIDANPHATFNSVGSATVPDFDFYRENINGVRSIIVSTPNTLEEVFLTFNPLLFNGTNEFSGNSVIGNVDNGYSFYPEIAGVGIYDITLKHTDIQGCVAEEIKSIQVFDEANSITGVNSFYCITNDVNEKITITNSKSGYTLQSITINADELTDPGETNNVLIDIGGSEYDFYYHRATIDQLMPVLPDTSLVKQGQGVQVRLVAIYRKNDTALDEEFTKLITINEAPEITFDVTDIGPNGNVVDFCEDGELITLQGGIDENFEGGTFQIQRVDAVFDPIIGATDVDDNELGTASVDPTDISVGSTGKRFYRFDYTDFASTCASYDTLSINVNPKPVAEFTTEVNGLNTGFKGCITDPNLPFEATAISFVPNNVGMIPDDGHDWDFDDFNNNTSRLPNPTHQYSSLGTYNVEYTVTSNKGCISDVAIIPVDIGNNPVPEFTFNQIGIDKDTEFQNATTGLDDMDPNDIINEVIWEYESGGTTEILNSGNRRADVSHNYTDLGVKSVSLTVATVSGCERTITKNIFVVPVETINAIDFYQEDFEDNQNDWIPQGKQGRIASWAISQSGGTGTISGNTDFWVTGTNINGYGEEKSYLYSPILDFSSLQRPVITFDYYADFRSGVKDGVYLEYRTYFDDNPTPWVEEEWIPLGQVESGFNWYESEDVASFNGENYLNNDKDYGWSAEDTGWLNARHSLSKIPLMDVINEEGGRSRVQFRFTFVAGENDNGHDGFAIDNIQIGERTRTVLVENFTNSSQVENMFDENNYLNTTFLSGISSGVDVIKINYHTDFPGEDPANILNPSDHGARAAYYNISTVPRVVLDGNNDEDGLFSDWGFNAFGQRSLILAEFKMNIIPTIVDDLLNIQIDMETDPQQPRLNDNDLVLNVAIIEKDVDVPTQPSTETEFFDVVRDLLPNAAGTLIPYEETTGTFSRSFDWIPSGTIDVSDLNVVAFIQDEKTKVVYQSEIADLSNLGLSVVTDVGKLDTNDLTLYPNPATDQVTVSFSAKLVNDHTIKIYDRFGKLLSEQAVSKDSQYYTFDTYAYINGVYFIQIEDSDKVIARKKLVILKQ